MTTPNFSYNGPELTQIEVTEDEVKKSMKNINEYKAVGPDGVPPKFLKECSEELTKPITMIIRRSLDTGQVPALWKVAQVCPVFKKGSKTDPLNYRPVSLTCVLCKLCEKIIRVKLVEHLETNNLITGKQHRFG